MAYTYTARREASFVKDFAQVIISALFLGLFSNICIPLFFTPVPIVLQNSISITYGYFLKSKKAYLSVILYIILGAAGLPFFAKGTFGLATLLGCTGGYIFGYPIAAYMVGRIFERSEKNISITVLLGHLIVLFCGCIWLSFFIGLQKAFLLGVLPFLAGDIFKTIIITNMIKKLRKN